MNDEDKSICHADEGLEENECGRGGKRETGDPPHVHDFYRTLFIHNHAVMLLIDSEDGAILDANPAASRFYGYSPKELLQKKIQEINTLSPQEIAREMERANSREKKFFLFRHRLKSGEIRDVEVYSGPIEMEGRPLLLSIVHDVSDRLRAEEELRQSETLYRNIARNFPDGAVLVFDRDLRYRVAEGTALAQFGFDKEMLEGKTIWEALDEETCRLIEPRFRRALSGESLKFETVFKEHVFLSRYVPLYNQEGEIIGGLVVAVDITERKRVEQALRKTHAERERHLAQLNALIHQMKEGLVIFDPHGNLIDINPAALAIHGFEDISTLSGTLENLTEIFDVFDMEGNPLPTELWPIGRVLMGESFDSYEVRVRLRDSGKSLIGSYGGTPVHDQEGKLLMSIVTMRDITERREAEEALKEREQELGKARDELEIRVRERTAELLKSNKALEAEIAVRKKIEDALRESEEKYHTLYDNAADLIAVTDLEGNLMDLNQRFEEESGYNRSEVLGKNVFSSGILTEQSVEDIRSRLEILLQGEVVPPFEVEGIKQDGGLIPYELRAAPIKKEGEMIRVQAILRNITERKQKENELRANAERLEFLNRELQEFAFVASHDLQEPLRKIQAFSDLLKFKHKERLPEEARGALTRIENSAARMQALLKDLLDYSRVAVRPEPFEIIRLEQVAREAVDDLEVIIERADGRVEIGPLPEIEADASLMGRIFQNLITNGMKYRRPEEKPVVKISGTISNHTCRLFIEDNGIGFEEKYLDRIFKPFQRLHGKTSPYEGTGMGLAICRKVAERHGGSITAKSAPGKGSIFIVTLPVRQE